MNTLLLQLISLCLILITGPLVIILLVNQNGNL
uniref:Photosystem II protein psb30 n=1 Tax=Codium arabicum TaxID=221038 RepID=A0A386B0P4_CODAR|nr:photosystem II protein psb30 [Codium arabicum]AYC65264.1 photosystem II protein psb30 [Codium arabicum]